MFGAILSFVLLKQRLIPKVLVQHILVLTMEVRIVVQRGDSAALARSNAMPLLKMQRCAVLRPTRRSLRVQAAIRQPPAPRRADTDRLIAPAAPTLPVFSAPALAALAGVLHDLLAAPAALAAEGVMYNPESGSETFKTVAGVGYIILVIVYFVRLFKKRADRFTSVRIASSDDDADKDEEDEEEEPAVADDDVTPGQCLLGFAQAATICYLLYLLSTNVDGFFEKQELPSQYTARNITVLIQTVVRGLVYLATFVFGANAVGLAALGVAITVAPEWVKAMEGGPRQKQEKTLPDVKITDDIYSLRRAFKEAEEMGRRKAEKEQK